MYDRIFQASLLVVAIGVIVALIAEYLIPGGSKILLLLAAVITGLGGLAATASGIITILPIKNIK